MKIPPNGLDYKRQPQKFVCLGLDLNNPVNLLPPGKFPFLSNARTYLEGRVESRSGTSQINPTILPNTNIHSIARVNNYQDANAIRLLGAASSLYLGSTLGNVFSSIDSGYSGNPLSIVPYKPDQSNVVWSYIADASRMRKVRNDGTNYKMGVAPPNTPPTAELTQPLYQYASNVFDSNAFWSLHNSASGSATGARLAGVTISSLLYNSGTTGWVGIVPTGTDASTLAAGMRISNGTETVVVEEVNYVVPGLSTVTVAQIQYDSGTTGMCTIVPSANLKGLRRNAMLFISSGIMRIISVTNAPDGSSSFRCSTGSLAVSAGDTILPPANGSIWVYTSTTWAVGNTLSAPLFSFAVNPGAPGTGSVAVNFAPGSPLNWGSIAAGRATAPDDYLHMSIRIDSPGNLVEGQLILDVDPTTIGTWAAADGNSNAYYTTFRASDFQPVVGGSQTTDDSRTPAVETLLQNTTSLQLASIQRARAAYAEGLSSTPQDISDPDSPLIPPTQGPASQLGAGLSQFYELKIKISALTRIGGFQAVDLSTIRAIQLRFTVINNIHVDVGDCWIGGGYGPDTSTNLTPFLYRFRYRSSLTGAASRPGPAMRSGMTAQRQAATITCVASGDPQVDKIDIERLGGTAPEWHYLGTAPNSSPTFLDDQLTAAVLINAPLDTDLFEPFPIIDTPRNSIVNVCGTALKWVSGDKFNVQWAADTEVKVNGKTTTLYATPQSDTVMYLDDSIAPSGAGASLEISEPILAAQPLPVMWGPFYDTMMAAGNINDPGSVYFTKQFNPDAAPDYNRVEITSPSETMMNGVVYDSRCYVFSDQRMFAAQPQGGENGITFTFPEVRNGKGLFSKWAITVGAKIWFLASDGIYETDGGEPVLISRDLAPLFPQGDNAVGFAVNGILPIDMNSILRLCAHQSYLFFDYVDTSGNSHTFVYDTADKAWFWDTYPWGFCSHFSESGLENGIETRALLGGGNNGFLYLHGESFSDSGFTIPVAGWTGAVDFGETRAKKIYGDMVFDLDPGDTTIFATPSTDNLTTDITPQGSWSGGRQITDPIDLGQGVGVFARNVGMKFSWSSSGSRPAIYYWEPSYLERPENTFLRGTDWGDGGYAGAKLVRGFILEADASDTVGNTRSFALQGDQATIQSYAGVFGGQLVQAFAINPPKAVSLLRILPTDAGQWRQFSVSYIYEQLPEYSAMSSVYSDEGYEGAKFVQGVIIEGSTVGDVSAQVQFDGDQAGPAITLNYPGSTLFAAPFSWVPFIAHNLRVVPAGPVRLGKIRWVFEPSPELAQYWFTQGTSHQIPGWQFLRDGYIAHISTAQVVLTVTVDGRNYTYYIPSSGGVYKKSYVVFGDGADPSTPLKGKLFTYSLFSTSPFRLFVRDSEVRVHPWAGPGYELRQPFGDNSFQQGAKI